MRLYINQMPSAIKENRLRAMIKKLLTEYEKEDKELSITYIDNEKIRQINIDYLQHDYYTDVIAFNLEDDLEDELLGEIYISHDQAKIQAEEYEVSYENELVRLSIHGILHVLGYEDDTPEKKQIMHEKENRWLGVYFANYNI